MFWNGNPTLDSLKRCLSSTFDSSSHQVHLTDWEDELQRCEREIVSRLHILMTIEAKLEALMYIYVDNILSRCVSRHSADANKLLSNCFSEWLKCPPMQTFIYETFLVGIDRFLARPIVWYFFNFWYNFFYRLLQNVWSALFWLWCRRLFLRSLCGLKEVSRLQLSDWLHVLRQPITESHAANRWEH